MNSSIFEIIGPVMVGPSSSHTAGAARLAFVSRAIAAQPFSHVTFGLHGSFAKTYKGHGTDLALLAGVQGLREDDEKLSHAFELAKENGITYEFYEVELDNVHENSVIITFDLADGKACKVIGSSIGGGQILIHSINGFDAQFTAQSPTLIVRQYDKKGVVSDVTKLLADQNINIGIMKVSRNAKGDKACCIIETDSVLDASLIEHIQAIENVISAQAVNIEESLS